MGLGPEPRYCKVLGMLLRSQFHKQILKLCTYVHYSGIMQPEWLKLVVWLSTANQSALFQHSDIGSWYKAHNLSSRNIWIF